jgi:membrane-bound ClpP family serine protease
MNDSTPRVVFAVLCLVGLVAILCGALFEFGRQKRSPTISSRHFRWRMVSALVWTVILGCLGYATLFLWPVTSPGVAPTAVAIKRFATVLIASMSLMLVAFVLMLFDFYLTSQTRRAQNARMQLEMAEIARIEIERAQQRAEQKRLEGGEIS